MLTHPERTSPASSAATDATAGSVPWALLAGAGFVVLSVVYFVVAGQPPDVDESGAEVKAFYEENKGEQQLAAYLAFWAALLLVFFAGALRTALRPRDDGPRGLGAAVLGGGVAAAIGGAMVATVGLALAAEPGTIDPAAAQGLNVLRSEIIGPIAMGTAVFTIASGVLINRSHVLPAWLGWSAILIGVVSITPIGFFAYLAFLVWTLVTSLMVATRARRIGPTP